MRTPVASMSRDDGRVTGSGKHRVTSSADRLAGLMLAVVALDMDVKTLGRWAAAVDVSIGSLRGYCRAAGVNPKQALDFARLLRVVFRSDAGPWDPAQWLDVSEPRHLQGLLARGGLSQLPAEAPPRLASYLERQWLIPLRSGVVQCVATRLAVPRAKRSAERSTEKSAKRSAK
jgi:hypothetical protein